MPRPKPGALGMVRYDFSRVTEVLVPYRRVSTREQADKGASLEAQRTKIEQGLVFRDQVALTWECEDAGKSAENLDRPGIQQALDHIYAKRASGIIVAKLDRLTRDLLDFATLMAKANAEGWNIVLLDIGIDLQTPVGKLMAGILALFAQFERDLIIQRTTDGLAEKKAQGVRLGRKRIVDDNLLMAIVGMYQIDKNFSKVARWLNEAGTPTPNGGRQWYPATIQKIVQSQDGRALMERLAA